MRCDRLHAVISVADCLRRRNDVLGIRPSSPSWAKKVGKEYHPCSDCRQGAAAEAGLLDDEDVMRIMDEIAGYGPGKPKKEETLMRDEDGSASQMKLCARHGKGCAVDGPQPLEAFHRDSAAKDGRRALCKSCARHDAAQRWSQKMGKTIPETVDERRQALPPARETAPARLTLTLDFQRYPNILEFVKGRALEELRTPENQVLWIVREAMREETVCGE